MTISNFLSRGEETAVHLTELCKRAGASQTSVKAAIRRERLNGIPILSGNSGYWIGESREEKQSFLRMMRMQAESRIMVAEAVKEMELENGKRMDCGSPQDI